MNLPIYVCKMIQFALKLINDYYKENNEYWYVILREHFHNHNYKSEWLIFDDIPTYKFLILNVKKMAKI